MGKMECEFAQSGAYKLDCVFQSTRPRGARREHLPTTASRVGRKSVA